MELYESFLEALGEAVRQHKNANRLAQAAGMSDTTIKRWLNKERIPTLVSVQQVVPFLDWNPFEPRKKAITPSNTSVKLREAEKRITILEAELEKERAISATLKEVLSARSLVDSEYKKLA